MARTIDIIFKNLIATKEADSALAALSSTSKVAIWRLLLYVVAVCMWTIEKLFDTHVAETKELLAKDKTLRPRWYAEMAKKFQFGDALVADQDYYDNSALTAAEIETRRVVKFASAVELGNGLRMKIAGIVSGSLAPITAPQLAALIAYMNKVKGAGTYLSYVNSVADDLKLSLKIYYDPLVLDAIGQRLDGTNNTPVQGAIQDYLVNGIDFNGIFITTKLIDRLQQVDGVKNPVATLVQAKHGLLPFSDIIDQYNPDAGYLNLDPSDLSLTFIPIS